MIYYKKGKNTYCKAIPSEHQIWAVVEISNTFISFTNDIANSIKAREKITKKEFNEKAKKFYEKVID